MKYILWTLFGFAMLVAGGVWLFQLISDNTRFLVLPHVLRYQGALLLIVVGGSLALLVSRAGKQSRLEQSLQQKYPAQPWMWRSDWAQSMSRASNRIQIGATIFAIIWTLLGVPLVIAALPQYRHDLLFVIVFAYGFPLSGFSMLFWQAFKWFRYISAGKILLHFKQLPARVGDRFDCELSIPVFSRSLRYEAELVCLNEHVETTKTFDGYESRWVRDEVWRQLITPHQINTLLGTRLTMQFQIPDQNPPTAYKRDNGFKWYVIVRAIRKNGHTQLEREFEVPVSDTLMQENPTQEKPTQQKQGRATFHVPAAEEGVVRERAYSQARIIPRETKPAVTNNIKNAYNESIPTNAIQHLKGLGVRFSKQGIEYEDAFWSKTGVHQSSIILVIIGLIFTSAFTGVFYVEVIVKGRLFALPSGLGVMAGLAILILAVYLRYHRFTIAFTMEGIVRHSRLFSWQWQKLFPWSNVRRIATTRSASVNTAQRRIHYDKVIIYGNSYKENLTLSPGFRNEQDAQLLCNLLQREIDNRRSQ